ncbi:hypothetical protein PoB_003997600 [Plakobranchus ocellatus]|uniref:Uncharacterized protein n=1 Tax=Plakobranchus ocellatus TaxID=259542 RepID=A0AAV4B3S5_9GAST|nr:hypothetical protein PoB_003997600 [Plakobranchus ocellatus]
MYAYFSPWPAVPDLIAPFSTSLLVGEEIALDLILFSTYGSEWKKLVLNIRQEDFVRLGAAHTDRLRGWKKVSQSSTFLIPAFDGKQIKDMCNTCGGSVDNFLFQCSEQPCHPGGHASMIPRVTGLESKPRKAPASRVCAAEAATTNLSEIVQELKNKNYVSDSCAELLEQSFSGVPLQLMKRILQKKGQGHFIRL